MGSERTENIRLEEIESSDVDSKEVWLITLSNALTGQGPLAAMRAAAGALGAKDSVEFRDSKPHIRYCGRGRENAATTITIDLQPEIERGLSARAQAKGVSLADFAREVLAREAGAVPPNDGPASNAGNLYELFAPLRGLLTDEEIDQYFSRTPSSSRPVDFE